MKNGNFNFFVKAKIQTRHLVTANQEHTYAQIQKL
jgi:hypothetical protein